MPNVATILTLGYEKRSIADFVSILRDAEVDVVVDVRAVAWSHKPGFSKTALQQALCAAGIEYQHAQAAGNPKALRNGAPDHRTVLQRFADHFAARPDLEEEFHRLLGGYLVQEKRVCLVCFERHPEDCHRHIVADRWAQRHGGRVRHLAPDGCRRLVDLAKG